MARKTAPAFDKMLFVLLDLALVTVCAVAGASLFWARSGTPTVLWGLCMSSPLNGQGQNVSTAPCNGTRPDLDGLWEAALFDPCVKRCAAHGHIAQNFRQSPECSRWGWGGQIDLGLRGCAG